jgi:hypothetical protein
MGEHRIAMKHSLMRESGAIAEVDDCGRIMVMGYVLALKKNSLGLGDAVPVRMHH